MTIAPYVRAPFSKEESLAELYHENTKIRAYVRDLVEDPSGASVELPPSASLTYAPDERVALPPARALATPLSDAILARRSRRGLSGEPLVLDELATLLSLAYGVGAHGRTAPSAGARYPLEWFVLARAVEGLEPGAWHYGPGSHALEPVHAPDAWSRARAALFDQPFLADAAAILLVGAVFSRTCVKYGERGYRLVLLDAGHAMQNALLAATALGLAATPLGGFVDDELNEIAMLDGVDENVLYAAALGRPAAE